MGRRQFNKKEIRQMKRAYLKTESLALTAKIMGCTSRAVAKQRDKGGWLGPSQIVKHRSDAGGSTLTPDISTRLAFGWRQKIGDEALCDIVGVSYTQLRNWLYKNTTTAIWRNRVVIINGKEEQEKYTESIGLRDLRTRERESLVYDYLQRHERLLQKAEESKDFGAALRGVEWRLKVQDPKRFADKKAGINVNVATAVQQNNGRFDIDELDLDLDTRLKLLEAFERQNGNGEKTS